VSWQSFFRFSRASSHAGSRSVPGARVVSLTVIQLAERKADCAEIVECLGVPGVPVEEGEKRSVGTLEVALAIALVGPLPR
jgi:methenyltetrahydromethanopterin cyclohydrolase